MGLRFRICNWICGDYLRNYLAVGVRLPLINFLKYNSKNRVEKQRQDSKRKKSQKTS